MRGVIALALALITSPALAQFVGVPKPAPIVITVDKRDQRMVVTVDGQPRFKWGVSTGMRGFDTPSGLQIRYHDHCALMPYRATLATGIAELIALVVVVLRARC